MFFDYGSELIKQSKFPWTKTPSKYWITDHWHFQLIGLDSNRKFRPPILLLPPMKTNDAQMIKLVLWSWYEA